MGDFITGLKTRAADLECCLSEVEKQNANLKSEIEAQKIQVDFKQQEFDMETKTLRDSVDLLRSQIKQKESEEMASLATSLSEAHRLSEKQAIMVSALERKVHALEIELARNLETLWSKDQIIMDLKKHLEESTKSFSIRMGYLNDEMRGKDLELDAIQLTKSRLDLRVVNLENEVDSLKRDRERMSELEAQLKDIEKLRIENKQLRTINIKVLQRLT